MANWERYRLWLKGGKYEVAVGRNRYEAIAVATRDKGVNRKDIVAVGKATSKGRLFNAAV